MERMKYLVEQCNLASKAYYAEDREIMSNLEYDALYDELVLLEEKTGITLSNSPTQQVGYEAVDFLEKEAHESPMLSLSKTKDRDELKNWLGEKEGLLSWKLDGLTIVLTYRDGVLSRAVTRGNGEIGEVVTTNAKTFINVPLKISYTGELVLRGEAVISYSDFEKINEKIPSDEEKYKNPRNLCSGSVRQLSSEVTASRSVRFIAFSLVKADQVDFHNSREAQFTFLDGLGFETVQRVAVKKDNILAAIEDYAKRIEEYDIPSDGLVLSYEDIAYGEELGKTAKYPKHSIAFKWADELKETVLREVEWSASRTGLINPVAIFDSVELEGTTVSRASVHNISIVQELKLGIGDHITVYKANMIIPQIAENLTGSDNLVIPATCPVCHEKTKISQIGEAKMLYCTNPSCPAKKIKAFTLYVSRNALNMDGLSEQTLEKFIHNGFIHDFTDLYHLNRYAGEIITMEGFGEKSYKNLVENIEKSRDTTLPQLIYGLGIANIGVANAKMLCKAFSYDVEALISATREELAEIDGIGEVIADAIVSYFQNEENVCILRKLLEEVHIQEVTVNANQNLSGLVFCITGSLNGYENRDQMKAVIEERGGKVTGSVTSKTTALINNDITSSSSKNKKAKELGVPILTEEDFVAQYLTE